MPICRDCGGRMSGSWRWCAFCWETRGPVLLQDWGDLSLGERVGVWGAPRRGKTHQGTACAS
jgi:hypothetical protein